jgi:hypothetical protein
MEFGRYLVLSTAHVRCSTGQLLDQWAKLSATEQPLPVASTHYGWFIATRLVEGDAAKRLPAELPPILAFARALDCDHVLFDCDGPEIAALTQFPW